jgi:hypothetical protein
MTTGAILTMIIVQLSVTLVTAYFFLKVLRTPPGKDPGTVPKEEP